MSTPYPQKHYPATLTFADALRFDDGDLVQHLLRKGLEPDSRSSNGKPLLLEAIIAHKAEVEHALTKAGATENFFTDAERQEAALHREPLYRGHAEWMNRPLLELCREQMKEAEAAGDWKTLANLRDRERKLTYNAPILNRAAFQTLLSDLEEVGIEVPDLNEWPEGSAKPTSRAMAAMAILIRKGDAYWLKRLLETGTDPNNYIYKAHERLPLCEAIRWHPALVPLLLEYGADPSGDGDDCIPLWNAITHNTDASESLIELLLNAGANPFVERSLDGSTPLFEAVVHGNYPLVRRLLSMGANPNPQCAENIYTLPLTMAINEADVGMVQELLDAGASPLLIPDDGFVDNWYGQCPLHVAENDFRWSARNPYREAEDKRRRKHGRRILESIYERYPDIDRLPTPEQWNEHNADKTAYFNAMLWNSAAYGMRENAVNLLGYFGASPNACNSAGIPALVIAAARGHTEIVYELLCYGATPELPPHLLAAAGCTSEVNAKIRHLIRCFREES